MPVVFLNATVFTEAVHVCKCILDWSLQILVFFFFCYQSDCEFHQIWLNKLISCQWIKQVNENA